MYVCVHVCVDIQFRSVGPAFLRVFENTEEMIYIYIYIYICMDVRMYV